MKISHIALSAALLASGTHAFMTQKTSQSVRCSASPLFLEPSALTEYMAKAHEDKLRAVQQAEAKKNEEIKVQFRDFACARYHVVTNPGFLLH